MRSQEPTLADLPNPILRYFLATRPAFLSVTLIACLIGFATVFGSGSYVSATLAVKTLVLALLAHAGINVINDYYDARNGTDAINSERVFPYTGGSRFIQNGVLTERQVAGFGALLFIVVIVVGLVLARSFGRGLYIIGAAGLFIGWAYSAPPLKLNSRGAGELCVAFGFGLVVVGADYVQRGGLHFTPIAAAVSYALLVANILYMNQFPDRTADARSGKRHWVVRLPLEQASKGYVLVAAAAYVWLVGTVVFRALPPSALLALFAVPFSVAAARGLFRDAHTPGQLRVPIQQTIAAACAHGALLAVGLVLARFL